MLTNAQKIAESLRLKEEGNAFVQLKEYKKACKTYRRVFAYTNGMVGKGDAFAQYAQSDAILSDTENKQLKDVKLSTYLNLAHCYLKLGELVKAYEAAEEALHIDSNNVKALYRLGSACIGLKRWDKAKESLVQALKLEPDNGAVKAEMNALKTAFGKWTEEQKAKEKALFAGKLL